MHRAGILTIITLATALSAQGAVTTPPGMLSTEGDGYADVAFGNHPASRYVLVDGSWKGTAMTIKGLGLRADDRTHSGNDSVGRSWSSVVVQAYAADHDGHTASTRTFTTMPLTKPSLVFSGSMSWPTLQGRPANQPAAFAYAMPFSVPWIYTGTQDLALDWTFRGGKLQNGGSWKSNQGMTYYFDGPGGNAGYANGPTRVFGVHGARMGCYDNRSSLALGAYTRTLLSSYNARFDRKSYRDTFRVSVASYFTAANRPLIMGIGLKGAAGLSIPGVSCNKIHLDLAKQYALLPLGPTSSTGFVSQLLMSTPFNSQFVGLTMFSQAAWADSSLGTLKLSAGSEASMPDRPALGHPRRSIWTADITSPTGMVSNEPTHLPLFLLRR